MHMALRFTLGILLFLLAACAQVKSLTGGPKDEFAPIPLAIVPKNETVNFKGNAMALSFDEYIKLNNPAQTISVIPNDIKIKTELRDKTLMLFWEEELRENTTYSIFLNRTIRDVSESNDSIIQLVFSTGSYIDSLSYSTIVVDAKDASPKKNAVVGLFEHPDSLRPIYFGLTDATGKVQLNYLKEGIFYVRAFEDQTKQGSIGKTDAIAFKEEPINPGMNLVDSVPLKMFAQLPKPDITTFKYQAPATFIVGANTEIQDADIRLNNEPLSQNNIKFYEKDSFMYVIKPGEINPMVLAITTPEWTDTIRTRINTTRNKVQSIRMESKDYFPGKPIILSQNDLITGIDTSKISIFNLSDSTYIKDYSYSIEYGNELHLLIPNFEGEKLSINLKTGAIIASEDWKISDFEGIVTKRLDKEFGVLNVKVSGYITPIILEMNLKGKLVKREFLTEDSVIKFDHLEPGEYTFSITIDENGNQKWDTGSFLDRIQPEEIQLFSKPTKVRANWEIDLELVPLSSTID